MPDQSQSFLNSHLPGLILTRPEYDNIQYFEALSHIGGFRGSGITQKTVKNKVGKLRKKLIPNDGEILTDSTTGKKIEVNEYENVKIGLAGNIYVQTWEEISTDSGSDEEEDQLQDVVKPLPYAIAVQRLKNALGADRIG